MIGEESGLQPVPGEPPTGSGASPSQEVAPAAVGSSLPDGLQGQPADLARTVPGSFSSATVGVVGATREPVVVWLLGMTLIYPYIWYFKINKELGNFSSDIKVSPGVSVLAVTLGAFVLIPAIVSWLRTAGRIKKAQQIAGAKPSCSGVVSLLCLWFSSIYIQHQLNKVWMQYGSPPAGTPARRG
ncbi:MAG: hypothetical protein ACYDEY_10590 [Acidimicrobiales bacterium]